MIVLSVQNPIAHRPHRHPLAKTRAAGNHCGVMSTRSTTRHRARQALLNRPGTPACAAAIASAVGLLLAGCQPALFPRDASRTQFEATERARARSAPAYTFDSTGRRRPNLTGRLLDKP